MTARTERHPAAPKDGIEGEGRKGMPTGGTGTTARTERHPAAPKDGIEGEGRKGMPTGGTA